MEVILTDSTRRTGEPATWGSGQRQVNCSWATWAPFNGRSTPDQFDPALAESGCFGRWKGPSERGRNTARGIDQRTFEQPLSSLRARPLVRTRGEEPVAGRSPAGALYR